MARSEADLNIINLLTGFFQRMSQQQALLRLMSTLEIQAGWLECGPR